MGIVLKTTLQSAVLPQLQIRGDSCLPAAVAMALQENGWCNPTEDAQRRIISDLKNNKTWGSMKSMEEYLNRRWHVHARFLPGLPPE